MQIQDACAGILYRHGEAAKSKLTGSVVVTLNYLDGGIAKASIQVNGPLLPGAKPNPEFDKPGKNFG
jgi:hypothetical protein